MHNYSIDAIKVAKAIQKSKLSILDGKEFKMRDKIKKKKRRGTHVKKPKKNKYTLNQLGMTVDKLARIVNDGFSELKQDIKDINARLDYIVDANNLKDSK